jgi:hypothetical protein
MRTFQPLLEKQGCLASLLTALTSLTLLLRRLLAYDIRIRNPVIEVGAAKAARESRLS